MKWIPIILLTGCVAFAATGAMGNDKIYTWIDENGVVNYTNTLPPEGATIIESEKEIPHDAQQASQRQLEQQRYLEQLRREQQITEQKAESPPGPENPADRQSVSDTKTDRQQIENSRERQGKTWHQRQIREHKREKLQEQKFGG
jgi:hypothetical protein